MLAQLRGLEFAASPAFVATAAAAAAAAAAAVAAAAAAAVAAAVAVAGLLSPWACRRRGYRAKMNQTLLVTSTNYFELEQHSGAQNEMHGWTCATTSHF